MNNSKILVLFHRNCIDGFISAWITRQFFGYDRVELISMDYGDPVPDLKGRTAYIVDFSFKPMLLLPAIVEAKAVVMLDHHINAIEQWDGVELPENLTFVKDNTRSGIGIVWDFLYSKNLLPRLFAHAQDYDLWTFKIPFSREVVSALYTKGFVQTEDFKYFDELYDQYNSNPKELLLQLRHEGKAIIEGNRIIINAIIKRNMTLVTLAGCIVPMCNIPHEHASLAGELLAINYPFAILYEDRLSQGVRKYSLRSTVGVGIDVNTVANLFGGGGHFHSAGFTTTLTTPLPIFKTKEFNENENQSTPF